MNIFSPLFSSLVFILCPLFFYIVFLSSNNSITNKNKKLVFDIVLLTTIYVVSIYNNIYPIISFLLLNSLVLIGYLRKRIGIANICAILIIFIYYNNFNLILFMIFPYIILYSINIIKNKYNINDFIFIDLFLLVEYLFLIIWIFKFNYDIYTSLGVDK